MSLQTEWKSLQKQITTNSGKDVNKRELSYNVYENENYSKSLGKSA